ncbi:hypothetical protein H7R52_18305 [Weissella confusa]|uniref:Uncharacterized protein n=1 Tax=Weissella confusa TaxID=1583 RepID=A0A923NFQ8_WEICO|nr:hypothetical protein [Weissella confusa]
MDVWQISDDMSPAVWVQDAFKQGLLHWDAREENTLMLNAPWSVAMGACGDFLTRDGQELRIVNENPLYYQSSATLMRPSVKNVVLNPVGSPYDWKWAYKK